MTSVRPDVRIVPYGDRGWMLEVEPGTAAAWSLAIERLSIHGIDDIVPAARTVVVRCADAAAAAVARTHLVELRPDSSTSAVDARTVEIEVRYDGPDLDEVAERCGATVDDVVSWHTGSDLVVAFCGFSPGFAYLTGLDPRLHLPRRSTPRTRVPAGSVAVASKMSAVYPSASPGGWHLLGTTDAVVWDVGRDPPALLRPGTPVRFVDVGRTER